jgi:predicted transcriptional regulator
MSTTTIRLPDELKERIAAVAAREGTTPHSFMLEAIVEQTDLAERRAEFDAPADTRLSQFLNDGKSIPWPEMRRYLENRIQGKTVPRPIAKKLAR